jgi:RNA polymerase sigma-B factor
MSPAGTEPATRQRRGGIRHERNGVRAHHAIGEATTRDLFTAWQRHGDQPAREQLIERYTPLARGLARRYMRSSEPLEDLMQIASLGLLRAVDRYDADRGRPFPVFAVPTILGELRRHFRDAGWAVHVPRAAKERAREVRDAAELLLSAHGRSPTVNQLAEYLELDVEQVLDAMAAMEAYETCSLDAPRPSEDGTGRSYAETIGDDDERFELVECDVTLRTALAEISPRDQAILRMRFVEDLTQSQIAGRVGISQMQVSRLLRQSLERLKRLTQTAADAP